MGSCFICKLPRLICRLHRSWRTERKPICMSETTTAACTTQKATNLIGHEGEHVNQNNVRTGEERTPPTYNLCTKQP